MYLLLLSQNLVIELNEIVNGYMSCGMNWWHRKRIMFGFSLNCQKVRTKKAMVSKWVYNTKDKLVGNIDTHRDRLVAKG